MLIPPHAGVLSAVGLALARERREAMASVMRRSDAASGTQLDGVIAGLAKRLNGDTAWTHESIARARYAGQGHELDVPVGVDLAATVAAFESTHEALFGYRLERAVEIVSLRHVISGSERSIRLEAEGDARSIEGPASLALSDATMYVAPGWTARSLPIGGWMLERDS